MKFYYLSDLLKTPRLLQKEQIFDRLGMEHAPSPKYKPPEQSCLHFNFNTKMLLRFSESNPKVLYYTLLYYIMPLCTCPSWLRLAIYLMPVYWPLPDGQQQQFCIRGCCIIISSQNRNPNNYRDDTKSKTFAWSKCHSTSWTVYNNLSCFVIRYCFFT